MLSPDERRISLKEIMAHPWMNNEIPRRELSINFEKIRSYSKFSKVLVVLGSSKW